MGYEGHIVGNPDRQARLDAIEPALAALAMAHAEVGGEVISSGGTGTYDINTLATEIQAGSYVLLDTAYAKLDLPFRQGLALMVTVLSVAEGGWATGDGGLKALGMDHGDPEAMHGAVLYCSDEHVTFVPDSAHPVAVGDRVLLRPAHIDPTIAKHEVLHVVEPAPGGDPQQRLLDGEVVDTWAIDLRGW
jgi:D-serine deaminase-like pyridoxal phosphate-dependent protein